MTNLSMDRSGTFGADVRNWTRGRFGSDAFDFFDRAYILDWSMQSVCISLEYR